MRYRSIAAALLAAAAAGTARAGCSDAEHRDWLAARPRFVELGTVEYFDAILRRRMELCADVAAGRLTQQAADRQFERERHAILQRLGKRDTGY